MLSPLQIGLLVAAAICAGGFGWHFIGRPSLAKKIGWSALFAAIVGFAWFLVVSREVPFQELFDRSIRVTHAMTFPLILAIPLVISLWICGLYSARWLCQKFHRRSASAPAPPAD